MVLGDLNTLMTSQDKEGGLAGDKLWNQWSRGDGTNLWLGGSKSNWMSTNMDKWHGLKKIRSSVGQHEVATRGLPKLCGLSCALMLIKSLMLCGFLTGCWVAQTVPPLSSTTCGCFIRASMDWLMPRGENWWLGQLNITSKKVIMAKTTS